MSNYKGYHESATLFKFNGLKVLRVHVRISGNTEYQMYRLKGVAI
ncbi:MAG: hypothetical protein Q7T96_07715 [Methylobacter sp.]|nr:hypothetical protein [Methylobacter sp.]